MVFENKIPFEEIKEGIEKIKTIFEIFKKKEHVILFLYLLHHSDYGTHIADIFDKVADEKKRKVNFPLSLTYHSKVNNFLKNMEDAQVVKLYKKEKVKGPLRNYYSVTPIVFTQDMKIEIPCEHSSSKIQFDRIVKVIIDTIQEISPNEISCVKKIESYTKYDYTTILLHFKNLLAEIVMLSSERWKDTEKPFLDQKNLLKAINMEGEKEAAYQTHNLFLCSRAYILLLSSIIMAALHEEKGMEDLTFSGSWDFDHIT